MSIFLDLDDQVLCGEHEIRAAAYPASLPEKIRLEHLDQYGFANVDEGEKPKLKPWQEIAHEIINDGSKYKLVYSAVDAENAVQIRAATITSKRYEVETAGIVLNGVPIPTDRHTQQVLTAMYIRAIADSDYTVKFKASNGFVYLNAAAIITIAGAVHDHVQLAFDREGGLLERLENGELVSSDDW